VPRPLRSEHQSVTLDALFDRFPAERAHVEWAKPSQSPLVHC
jgi:hypothetical protein